MAENRGYYILKKLLNKERVKKYEKDLIFQDDQGVYHLYGKYSIWFTDGYYVVSKHGTHDSLKFSELKNAVTWVTLERRNKFYDSSKVYELDGLLAGAKNSFKLHEKLYKKAKTLDQRSIYDTKLVEDTHNREIISQKLNFYINSCKAWQMEQFSVNTGK